MSPGDCDESLMHVTREVGVRNAGQPGALERHGGRAGAGVTDIVYIEYRYSIYRIYTALVKQDALDKDTVKNMKVVKQYANTIKLFF